MASFARRWAAASEAPREPDPAALLARAIAELARADGDARRVDEALLDTAADATGAGVVLLYDVLEDGSPCPRAQRGLDDENATRWRASPAPALAARALRAGRTEAVEIDDATRRLADVRAIDAAGGSRWAAAIPSAARDAVVTIGLRRAEPPGPREELVMRSIADLLSVARIAEREREREQVLRAGVKAVRAFAPADASIEAIARELAAHAARVSHASFAAVALTMDGDPGEALWVGVEGPLDPPPPIAPVPAPARADGPLAIADAAREPSLARLFGEAAAPPGPVLVVPLRAGNRRVGSLFVARERGEPPFSSAIGPALEHLASHATSRLGEPAHERPRHAGEARERAFERLLEVAPVAIGHIAPDGRFLRVNARLCRLLGYSSDDLRAARLQDLTEDDEQGPLRLPESETWRTSRRFVRKGGGVLELDLRCCLVRDRSGAPEFVIAHFDDTTSRRRAERALAAGERELRALFENASDGMMLFDNALRIVDLNASASALFNMPRAALVGRSLDELGAASAGDVEQTFAERVRRLLEEGRQLGRLTLLTGGGDPIEVEYSARAHVVPGKHLALLRDVTERARAEAVSRRTQEALTQAARLAHVGSWDWDLVEGTTTCSDECHRIIGRVRRRRETSAAVVSLVHPADRPRVEAALHAAIHEGRPYTQEYRVVRDDGETRIVVERAEVLRDREGRPLRMLGAVQDVTDQRRAEQALRHSEERLRLITSSIGDALCLVRVEPALALEYVSPSIERLTGHPASSFYANPALARTLVHPDDLPKVEAYLTQRNDAAAAGGWSTLTLRVVRPDRGIVWVETRVTRMHDASGTRLVAVARDVTAHEQLVAQLAAERSWLRTVIERSPAGILLTDGPSGAKGVIANRRAEEILGIRIDPQGGIEQYVGTICAADGTPLPEDELPSSRALTGQSDTGRELAVVRPDGRRVPVLVSAGPIRGERGEVVGTVVVFEDVSLLKDLERLRDEWTALVAHDLRQPLTTIAAYAGMLARRPEDETMRARAEHILSSTHLLSRMVGDLLDASRVESRHLELVSRRVDLAALARGVVERVTLHQKPVRLRIQAGLPCIVGDPDRIEQVLSNLLSNAAKYGDPQDPKIELTMRAAGDGEIEVAVRNAGPGLSPEEIGKLFQRFGKVADGRRGSLGLGLYISKGIVEAHGGRIWAESAPGEMTFRFTLPIEPPSPAQEQGGAAGAR